MIKNLFNKLSEQERQDLVETIDAQKQAAIKTPGIKKVSIESIEYITDQALNIHMLITSIKSVDTGEVLVDRKFLSRRDPNTNKLLTVRSTWKFLFDVYRISMNNINLTIEQLLNSFSEKEDYTFKNNVKGFKSTLKNIKDKQMYIGTITEIYAEDKNNINSAAKKRQIIDSYSVFNLKKFSVNELKMKLTEPKEFNQRDEYLKTKCVAARGSKSNVNVINMLNQCNNKETTQTNSIEELIDDIVY